MKIIDAHQHYWNYNPVRDAWINDEMSVIQRDFLPEDLQGILAENKVSGTIAVQADQSLDETRFLLNLAENNDSILGVVGWIDLRSPNLEEDLKEFESQTYLSGFRHVVQGESDPLFMLRPDFLRGLEIIFERGYTYDILIYPHQLIAALELAKLFPNQPMVIDHMAKPYIKDGYIDGWAAIMKELSNYEQMYCKVSGLITEANWSQWTDKDIFPYLDHVTKYFSSDRLMFGSDWPVALVAGQYKEVLDLVKTYIQVWEEEDQRNILSRSAEEFYLKQIIDES
ncbi:amidohydrolase family protein [Membranihabitans marinus]|uniref:amidohydrolase family protein n=1 Tax=Membranihabitans marinus TaxID=1227546 RepID=UPI001F27C76D|nr:amidohydrolase family protein [Membranihabitans marinus]